MQKFLSSLNDEEATILRYLWTFWQRENQSPPTDLEWLTWVIMAGRGGGKTRMGSEWVRSLIESGRYSRIALVAEDAGDAREVMVEGESGILACCPPWNRPHYEPSKKRLTWPSGARATIYSSDDPESLRGPQHDAAWLDELCKWRYAQETWTQLQFGLRLGKRPLQCVTTTPRNIPLLKQLLAKNTTRLTTFSTYDNLDNLAPNFREEIVSQYEGTRLGRQELHAQILDDNPDALFHSSNIETYRQKTQPEDKARVIIAVDPPVTGTDTSDECGIIAASRDSTDTRTCNFHVLGDHSVQGRSPEGWAQKAISAYYLHTADAIVAEVNNGGDLVESVLRQVDPTVRVIKVRASRGKWIRAEPVAGLYEQGRVHHVGIFPKLEDQMCDFDPSGQSQGKSPDRLDALVWALTELGNKQQAKPGVRVL